jgi:hypothetical protein
MAMDKKITDLTYASIVTGDDVGIMVRDGTDYQFPFSNFLQYISGNLYTGASISFGIISPQNNQGNDGDLFINTSDSSFLQKIHGVWVQQYQNSSNSNNSVLYDFGLPCNTLGNNGDTYIDTLTGIFYKKSNNIWTQVFSMQTGPVGPPGIKGDTGLPGLNGKSLLNGTTNPSNSSAGSDGDVYINTSTWTIFGPKTSGDWGFGYQLNLGSAQVKILPADSRLSTRETGTLRLTWDDALKVQFGTSEATFKYVFSDASIGPYKYNTSVQPIYNYDGSGDVSFIDFEGVFDTYYKIIITS